MKGRKERVLFTGRKQVAVRKRPAFTGLTDEDLAEVFGIDDTEETQDNGDERIEEHLIKFGKMFHWL